MAKRGTKPKPTRLKVIAGNPGKRKLAADKPGLVPLAVDDPPPAELDEIGARRWSELLQELSVCEFLTRIDRDALALYCGAYSRWTRANEAINEFGLMVKGPAGHPAHSPYLAIANKAFEQMRQLLAEFGMTPSARSRQPTSGDKANQFANNGVGRQQTAGG